MQMIVFVCVLAAAGTFHVSSAAEGPTWGYDEHHGNGPLKWKDNYPQCAGSKQSPINVAVTSTKYEATLNDFSFHGYDTTTNYVYELTNNGHTAQLNIKTGAMTIEQGGLPNQFQLAQLHFHWGTTNGVGSEHTINGKSYPLEVHFVHYNKKYDGVGTAVANPDGLAVLGIFFEVGDAANDVLQKILDHFGEITNKDQAANVAPFPLQGLLPANKRQYVRYSGSLTTPPCAESVTWTVFRDTIKISQTQLNKFRALNHNQAGQNAEPIGSNFRPVQPLNERVVSRSYEKLESSDKTGAGPTLHTATGSTTTFVVAAAVASIVCSTLIGY